MTVSKRTPSCDGAVTDLKIPLPSRTSASFAVVRFNVFPSTFVSFELLNSYQTPCMHVYSMYLWTCTVKRTDLHCWYDFTIQSDAKCLISTPAKRVRFTAHTVKHPRRFFFFFCVPENHIYTQLVLFVKRICFLFYFLQAACLFKVTLFFHLTDKYFYIFSFSKQQFFLFVRKTVKKFKKREIFFKKVVCVSNICVHVWT